MEPQLDSTTMVFPFPFAEQDGEQTPPAVQAYLHTLCHEMDQLQDRVASLEARLQQDSTNSSRPPSSDSPYQKPRRCGFIDTHAQRRRPTLAVLPLNRNLLPRGLLVLGYGSERG
jgi:Family of unknown function (DUF6444)